MLSIDPSSKLNIFWHDGLLTWVQGTEVSILQQFDQVILCSILECKYCGGLPSEVSLEILGDVLHQTAEYPHRYQQDNTILVEMDLS